MHRVSERSDNVRSKESLRWRTAIVAAVAYAAVVVTLGVFVADEPFSAWVALRLFLMVAASGIALVGVGAALHRAILVLTPVLGPLLRPIVDVTGKIFDGAVALLGTLLLLALGLFVVGDQRGKPTLALGFRIGLFGDRPLLSRGRTGLRNQPA